MAAARTITESFDEIADGAFVTIHSPFWMTASASTPDIDPASSEDVRRRQGAEWLCTLVKEWNVPDITVDGDEPTMSSEVTVAVALGLPSRIERWIVQTFQEYANPR